MPSAARGFLLYSRAHCGLCEEMLSELEAIPEVTAIGVEVADVDANPATQGRYGHKVPVLLLGGELVCHGRLDLEELHKALAHHRRPV
jgi:hypothetical protein